MTEREKYLEQGFDEYLGKPKEKEEFILNEVKKLLVENLPEYEIPITKSYLGW